MEGGGHDSRGLGRRGDGELDVRVVYEELWSPLLD
jgi:hypothetical protein